MRYIILALLLAFFFIGYSNAQNTDDVTCDNGWICI